MGLFFAVDSIFTIQFTIYGFNDKNNFDKTRCLNILETLADLLLVTVFDVGRSLEYIGEMTLRYLRSTNIDRIAGVFNLKKCYLKSVVECKTSFKNNQLFNENQSNTFLCFTKIMKKGKNIEFNAENQCLRFGSGSESVGSARFSLPGSGSGSKG